MLERSHRESATLSLRHYQNYTVQWIPLIEITWEMKSYFLNWMILANKDYKVDKSSKGIGAKHEIESGYSTSLLQLDKVREEITRKKSVLQG